MGAHKAPQRTPSLTTRVSRLVGTIYYLFVLAHLPDFIDHGARLASHPSGPNFGPSTFSAPHPLTYVTLTIYRYHGRVITNHLQLVGLIKTTPTTLIPYTLGKIRCKIHCIVYLPLTISTSSPEAAFSESQRSFISDSHKSKPMWHPPSSPR